MAHELADSTSKSKSHSTDHMTIRKLSLFILITAFQCGVSPHASAEAPNADGPATKPNIIFVIADDMGIMDTGYSGNPIAKTPHLDRMACRGAAI